MKTKYTLNIADMQLSVMTETPAEEVERIRGLLDRKMREIYLKSRCPKTEAALICAMDFASDRMSLQEQVADLSDKCERYTTAMDTLKERNTAQAAELDRLRNENAILRSLLTTDTAPAVAPDPISPTDFFAEVASAQTFGDIAAAVGQLLPEEAEEIAESTDPDQIDVFTPAEAPAPRSRVGSMFEQLSFGDVD